MYNINILNGFHLKVIAMILMTIDHLGGILFPEYIWMRMVGRLAFPIFAFLIVEGMVYTHDGKKYLMRLAAFALISEIPYDLAFFNCLLETENQNIFFTLFLGALGIYLCKNISYNAGKIGVILGVTMLGEFLHADYGAIGVFLILCLNEVRGGRMATFLVLCIINVGIYGGIQGFAILAILFILLYNNKRGAQMKLFFYVYYPLHLLLLYAIIRL